VADFYLDNDVTQRIAVLLQGAGHSVMAAGWIGLRAGSDAEQLLRAAEEGWILISHNREDYMLLHEAWLRWSRSWGVTAAHAGILVIPQPRDFPPDQATRELSRFVGSGRPLANELYRRPVGARPRWERWRLGRGWTGR